MNAGTQQRSNAATIIAINKPKNRSSARSKAKRFRWISYAFVSVCSFGMGVIFQGVDYKFSTYFNTYDGVGGVDTAIKKENHKYQEGWKNIPVFYGNTNMMHCKGEKWCGQFGQDIAVSSLLGNKNGGFFVDLAANHPTYLSSTFSLEQNLGWAGICIEPNSMHWWGLTQGRTCQLVGAVIGNNTMDRIKFRVKEVDGVGGHGGIVADGMDNVGAPEAHSKTFYTVGLREVFLKFQVPQRIDYLSLDVEGAEEFIMSVFPFKDYTISLISIERVKDELKDLLLKNGFKMVARLKEDTLWAHESARNILDAKQLAKYSKSLEANDPKFE
eukprot:CAMPEP_0194178540 /NCGR_PEP_ID=MMETSP0154-20130528/12104_1 /TAXON_ID=1049557 /ORGANISM="Thalassiothrix antarctica, Strain L6-D1" /LENGTH=327 /DNA_ID=CAMNT_0038893511 /DNA_START=71 /DNA_END=1054 /DNA_ORIENTATION=+